MTTDTFPFTADERQATPGLGDEPPEQGRRVSKRVLALGGGLLALVLAGGGFLLLSGGGGNSTQQALVPHGVRSTASPATPAGGHHKSHAKLPVYKGQPAGRDPFKPLVTAPPPPAPSQAAPAPSSTGVPVVGPGTGTGTGTGPGTGPTPAPTTAAPQTVLVFKGISFSPTNNKPLVDVTFDGKSYQLQVGATVGGTLKVVAIQPDDSMAVFQVGDQTFDLHVNQVWVG